MRRRRREQAEEERRAEVMLTTLALVIVELRAVVPDWPRRQRLIETIEWVLREDA